MEVRLTLQLTTTKLKTYVRPYAHRCCRRPTSYGSWRSGEIHS